MSFEAKPVLDAVATSSGDRSLFLGFVVISLSALWRTYRALNGTTAEQQVHWGTDSEFKRAILGRLTQPRWKVAICLHAVVDVIIIYFVWAIR